MANMCSNWVTFSGEQTHIDQLVNLFTAMAEKEKQTHKGQLPDFITDSTDYFFSIYQEPDFITYETRWSPNISTLQKIAEQFGVGFILDYSELGNMVFGEALFEDGELTDTFLDDEDFEQFDYDELADAYKFENEVYESSQEILEELLERKKAQPQEIKNLLNGEQSL